MEIEHFASFIENLDDETRENLLGVEEEHETFMQFISNLNDALENFRNEYNAWETKLQTAKHQRAQYTLQMEGMSKILDGEGPYNGTIYVKPQEADKIHIAYVFGSIEERVKILDQKISRYEAKVYQKQKVERLADEQRQMLENEEKSVDQPEE